MKLFKSTRLAYIEDIQDGDVRNASIKLAYVEDLKLPTVKWTIYEADRWGTEDMPVASFTTSSFDPQDVIQEVIKHYESEGAKWFPGTMGKEMDPQQYILGYLEMDHYDEGDFYTVDFCMPNSNKQKVAIYCNGYEVKE